MSNKSSSKSGGVGVLGLLGIVFVTLKLLEITVVATWSWWWVTLPFWGGLALVLAIIAIAGLGIFLAEILSRK